MVNYKRVVCEVALLSLLALSLCRAAPAPAPAPDCKHGESHYDQRQNGTENYRLNIDGVVIAVAPADSLLSAASDIDFNDLFDLEELNDLKPKPPSPSSEDKPPKPALEPKPEEGKPSKPEEGKPGKPEEGKPGKPDDLSDVSLRGDQHSQKQEKKEAGTRKQEKAQRLKHRLASILVPLLRRTRHH